MVRVGGTSKASYLEGVVSFSVVPFDLQDSGGDVHGHAEELRHEHEDKAFVV